MTSFSQLPVSPVLHGQNTISNMGDMSKVKESYLKVISGPAVEGGLKFSTNLVAYFGKVIFCLKSMLLRKYHQTVTIRK